MRRPIIIILFCLAFSQSFSQIAINPTGAAPHPSAMLDITSINKGLLIPRLTTAQRNTLGANAAKGLLVYDSVKHSFYFHDGTDWIRIVDDSSNYWGRFGTSIYTLNPGNVGIGLSTPVLKLDVKSPYSHTARFDGSDQTYITIYEGSLYRGFFGTIAGAAEDVDIGTGQGNTTGKLHFSIQESPKITMDTDGDLGIGTTSPGFPLTIVSNDDEGIGLYRNSTFSGAIRPTDTAMKVHGRYGSSSGNTTAANLLLQPPSGSQLLNLTGKIGMFTSSPKTDLHIDGDVLIGNAEPATGYAVSVDGKVVAEEVRVQLSSAWPDYVFHHTYKLRSISQLEQFIRNNNHLPNIPSAKEMQHGQDLGEIQRKMMEKIEELTLYIIQLEKRLAVIEKK